MAFPNVLYHGSPHKLKGDTLNPSQGDDSEERPENNFLAVYATDRKEFAIVMAIIGCKGVLGGSLDGYRDDVLQARIYGDLPKQKFIYLHHLPSETFKRTKVIKNQFVSMVSVKPLKTEKLLVKEYLHLVRMATEKETAQWIKKYGDPRKKTR